MILLQVVVTLLLVAIGNCNHDQIDAEIMDVDEEMAAAQYRYGGKSYQNNWDRPLHVECNARNGEAINQVRSIFHGTYRDRLWHFGCKRASSTPLTECAWTDYINNWQQSIRFMCPKGKIIAGVDSRHWNAKEDRRWKIKCCTARDHHTEECELTKYLNSGKTFFEHKATERSGQRKNQCSRRNKKPKKDRGAFFAGMVSNWKSNDRKWQMIECEFMEDEKKPSRRRYRKGWKRRHGVDDDDDDDSSKSSSSRSKSSRKSRSKSKSCSGGKCGGRSRDRSDDSRSKSRSRNRNRRRRYRYRSRSRGYRGKRSECDKCNRGKRSVDCDECIAKRFS